MVVLAGHWGYQIVDFLVLLLGTIVSYEGSQIYHSFVVVHIGLWVVMASFILFFIKNADLIMNTSNTNNWFEVIRSD